MEVSLSFQFFFLVISRSIWDGIVIYHFIIIMVEKNYWHELYTRQHIRGVVHFKRCVKHFPTIKIMILPCHFIFYHVLFHYRWRVLPKNSRFIIGDPFPPSFLSPTPKQLNLFLIFVGVSESILLVLIFFYFSHFLFC
jgi:hypothetical protein